MKKKTLYILFLVALLNSSCSLLDKLKKTETEPQLTTEDVIQMVMSQQVVTPQDTIVAKMSDKEQAEYKKELEKQMQEGEEKEPNWVQRMWRKIFPKKVENAPL